MKIQCDVCEKAPATVICCADEAALCAKCDVQVHAANKLASKHQRLLLQSLSTKLPPCDICQEKPAFIFCVEDRALFCKDCDGPIHSAGSLSANHQRFLATGIRVALSSGCSKDSEKRFLDPSNKSNPQYASLNVSAQQTSSYTSSWTMDDVLRFSDIESPQKEERKEQIELGGLEWLNDMDVFEDHPPQDAVAAAQVPQLPIAQFSNLISSSRSFKYNEPPTNQKPRLEPLQEDEYCVPDLG